MASAKPIVLTIAGFDPSSGAGITADLQVFAAHELFGTACITALTAQSTVGVSSVRAVDDFLNATLRTLTSDLPPVGIKIGMLGTAKAVTDVAAFLSQESTPRTAPRVLDPVLRSSSGSTLLTDEGVDLLREKLLTVVDWITPNRAELAFLTGMPANSEEEVERALLALQNSYPHLRIVATGGDAGRNLSTDIFLDTDGKFHRFEAPYIETSSTHGTGCAFSSALLSRLVLGEEPVQAIAAAKAYVTEAPSR